MQILLVLLFLVPYAQAMDPTSAKRFESTSKDRLDQVAQVIPLEPGYSTSPIVEVGNSVLSFFKSIPDKARSIPQAVKELLDLEEGASTSPDSSSESPYGVRMQESPTQESIIDRSVYPMPTLFQIQNNAGVPVFLTAVLTDPYKHKRYFLQPGDCMTIRSPDTAQFQELVVRPSMEEARREVWFTFMDDVYVRLLILSHPQIQKQLCIRKKT